MSSPTPAWPPCLNLWLPLRLETKAGSINPYLVSLLCIHKSKGWGIECMGKNVCCGEYSIVSLSVCMYFLLVQSMFISR